ncbi:hypothetical protein D9M68_496240 [compost metagenome]
MEKEFVLAGLSGVIWLLPIILIVVINRMDGDNDVGRQKLANALVLGCIATTACFALYLSLTMP